MEEKIDSLKTFILNNYKDYLDQAATPEIPLPMVKESNLVLGEVDPDRYTESPVIFIVPDEEAYSLETMEAEEEEDSLTLELYIKVCRNTSEKLYRQVLRYGACFRKMIQDHFTLGGAVTDTIIRSSEYFPAVEGASGTKIIKLSMEIRG